MKPVYQITVPFNMGGYTNVIAGEGLGWEPPKKYPEIAIHFTSSTREMFFQSLEEL